MDIDSKKFVLEDSDGVEVSSRSDNGPPKPERQDGQTVSRSDNGPPKPQRYEEGQEVFLGENVGQTTDGVDVVSKRIPMNQATGEIAQESLESEQNGVEPTEEYTLHQRPQFSQQPGMPIREGINDGAAANEELTVQQRPQFSQQPGMPIREGINDGAANEGCHVADGGIQSQVGLQEAFTAKCGITAESMGVSANDADFQNGIQVNDADINRIMDDVGVGSPTQDARVLGDTTAFTAKGLDF